MNAEQLLAAYPNAKQAVAHCELCLFLPPESLLPEVQHWVSIGGTLDDVTSMIRETIQESLAEDDLPNVPQMMDVLAQLDTDDFRRYLTGRLGLL